MTASLVYKERIKRFLLSLGALLALLVALSLLSISYGPAGLCPLFSEDCSRILQLRLSRTLSALGLGASLAVSGLLLQASTRNVLAEPSILGISSGALASYAATVLLAPTVFYDPFLAGIAAFVGGITAYAATLVVAEAAGGTATALILAGIAVTAATAGLAELLTFMVQRMYGIPFMILLLGTVAYTGLNDASLLLAVALVSAVAAAVMGKPLNTILVGDVYAAQLGYSPRLVRRLSTIVAALAASVGVAIAGIVGFIGLIAPHLARGMVGGDNRLLVPIAALIGSIIVVVADIASRVLDVFMALGELPLGLYTGILGGIFLAYLVATRMRRGLILEASS